MPDNSSVRVVALIGQIGIAALNPRTGSAPGSQGVASRVIGTSAGLERSCYIPVDRLSADEGRLAAELWALHNAGSVSVLIDGVAITRASQLLSVGIPDGLEHQCESFVSPFNNWQKLDGTWAEYYDDVNNRYYVERDAANATERVILAIPGALLRAGPDGAGVKPTGLVIYYGVTVAVIDDFTAVVYQITPPSATAALPVAASISASQTYDEDHDTAAERKTVASHRMEITFSDDDVAYLNSGEGLHVLASVDGSAAGIFRLYGWSFLYATRSGPSANEDYG